MANEIPKIGDQDDLLTVADASEFLKMTRGTLYHKISDRAIPFVKMPNSNRIYFSRMQLKNWLLMGQTPPARVLTIVGPNAQ